MESIDAQKLGEAVADGVKEGLIETSKSAPTNWIQMIVALAGLIVLALVVVWLVRRFIDVLQSLSERQEMLTREVIEANRENADACHRTQLSVQAAVGEQTSNLREVATKLADIHVDTRSVLDRVLDALNGRHQH